MPFKIANFGTFSAYDLWNENRDREYIVKLTNNDTLATEIIKNNPEGINNLGFSIVQSETYYGRFEEFNFTLSFDCKTGGGGTFLRSAYASKGIKADLSCDIYKLNPSTNDFDLLYATKADYNSYSDEIIFISTKLVQNELTKRFFTRDNTILDLKSTTSIDGNTVTAITPTTVICPPINIYLYANSTDGNIRASSVTYPTGINTWYYYYNYGGETINLTEGRINFQNPTNGRLYTNDTEEARYIRFEYDFGWSIETNCDSSNINIIYVFRVYNSSNVLLNSTTLLSYNHNGTTNPGIQTLTGTESGSVDYYEVPVDGYVVYEAISTSENSSDTTCKLNSMTFTGTIEHRLIERSNSIGQTTTTSCSINAALAHCFRLITGIETAYYSLANATNLFITSGWNLRKYTDKQFNVKTIDIIKSVINSFGAGLGFDKTNNRFYFSAIEDFYQDVEVVDFGEVRDFKITPSNDYITTMEAGCDTDGDYEEDEGVREFNIKHNYCTTFEVQETKDLKIPLRTDSLAFEYARRNNIYYFADKDTKYDKLIYLMYAEFIGGSWVIKVDEVSGFDGADEYYNAYFIARECIKRMGGVLGGMFFKETDFNDPDAYFKFTSNAKDINVSYDSGYEGVVNSKDWIPAYYLGAPYFYPEKQEFETDLTITQLAAIRANPNGYYKLTDKLGTVHYGYFRKFDVSDNEKKAKIEGVTANINRI